MKISKAKLLELIKEQLGLSETEWTSQRRQPRHSFQPDGSLKHVGTDTGKQLHPNLQRIQTAAGDQAGSKRRLQQELARLVGARASEVIVNALPPEAHVTLMAALGV
tara:strand:- start:796 stop:1116 length:321 start_codon:yes stop_codon:yes gene_type:complete